MPINVASRVLITYRGTWAAQRFQLGLSYVVSASTSPNTIIQDLGTLAGHFSSVVAFGILDSYRKCLPTDATIDFVRIQQTIPSRSVYLDNPLAVVGLFPQVASTGNLQFPITLHTAAGGRNQISVKKIGPAPNTTYTDGEPDPVYKAGPLSIFANVLRQQQITAAPVITLDPVVPHPFTVDDPVIGARLPTRVGTMRRRTVRVGE